jgi:Ca2+/Na+ antiporter
MPLAEHSAYVPTANLREYRMAPIQGVALTVEVLPALPGLVAEARDIARGWWRVADPEAAAGLVQRLTCTFRARGLFMLARKDDYPRPVLPPPAAAVTLVLLTGLIAVASELVTGSIRSVTDQTGIPQRLLSLILLPAAANCAEHFSAVICAAKGKLDLAHSIALGSSLQVATFVLPVAVLVAWGLGIPYSLDSLDPLLFFLLLLAVIHQQAVSGDGRSDWLTGMQLCCVYIIIALPSAYMQ